jgi:hypothetical protein
MESARAWQIIGANLDKLVGLMVTVQKGAWVDVYCDSAGTNLSYPSPSGSANLKLCAVTAPDLEGSYDVHLNGGDFVNGDGEKIPKGQLATYLVQSIVGMKDGGAEWGWEFKLS